ncbi:MAG TPA: hypothetical protein VEL74_11345 [Thermoanaerobaculia bacterium]|nr:hypothetical protein [Thermoanaerobaculia bacterium]
MRAQSVPENEAPRPGVRLPEPGRFWIRYVPRLWEPPEMPWLDFAEGKLGPWGRGKGRHLEPADLHQLAFPLDDLLYLPPVPEHLEAARREVAEKFLAAGTPVLRQVFPGDELPANGDAEDSAETVEEFPYLPRPATPEFVFDLLPALLELDFTRLARLPSGAAVVWPLLPGLTDSPSLWEEGCEVLAAAGVRHVQALAPALTPQDRRRLAERWGDEATFDALFHHAPPSEREFACTANGFGLFPFLPRPLPRPPIRGASNRRIAGVLALAAELWLRLGRPVEQGQAIYRAARWIDSANYDLKGLARERNLAVLTPLDALSRKLIAELFESGEPPLLRELLTEYVSPELSGGWADSGDTGTQEDSDD